MLHIYIEVRYIQYMILWKYSVNLWSLWETCNYLFIYFTKIHSEHSLGNYILEFTLSMNWIVSSLIGLRGPSSFFLVASFWRAPEKRRCVLACVCVYVCVCVWESGREDTVRLWESVCVRTHTHSHTHTRTSTDGSCSARPRSDNYRVWGALLNS